VLVAALRRELRDIGVDESVKVVVIRGSGGWFSGGADGAEAATLVDDPVAFLGWLAELGELFVEIERLPQPVIAAVDGVARRGGLELVLACDFVVASDRAELGDWHAAKGFFPAGGATQRLADAVGTRAARWLIYTGAMVGASEARALGLVQEVVDAARFDDEVLRLAQDIATKPRVVLLQAKRLTASTRITTAALDAERASAAILRSHPEVLQWKAEH
jgi:enoyl-CoA hydratase/carnithine racemase